MVGGCGSPARRARLAAIAGGSDFSSGIDGGCGASIGYGEGGELPRLALSARNLALALDLSAPASSAPAPAFRVPAFAQGAACP